MPPAVEPVPIRAGRSRRRPAQTPAEARPPRTRVPGTFAKYLANGSLPVYAMFEPLRIMCQAQPAVLHALTNYLAVLNLVTWDINHDPEDLRHSVMQSNHYSSLGDIVSVRSPRTESTVPA